MLVLARGMLIQECAHSNVSSHSITAEPARDLQNHG